MWIQIRPDILSGLIWVKNCLQRLSADDTSKQFVKVGDVFGKVNSGEDLSNFLPNGIYEYLSVKANVDNQQ